MEQLFEATMKAAVSTKHRREQDRLVQEYRTFCRAHSYDPRNPSLCSVGAFIVVRTKRLKGSTATISSVLGAIRRQCTLDKVSYLRPDEQLLLADLLTELEYNDARGIHQARPLSRLILDVMCHKGLRRIGREREAIVMMTVAHDGMLRAGEVTNELRAIDLAWNEKRNQVTISLLRTKKHRKRGAQLVTLFDYGPRSGCALLRRWIRDINVQNGSTDYLFPIWVERKGAFDKSRCVSYRTFNEMIKQSVTYIGLEAAAFSGHSCRAGGATDAFNAGVPYATVKKFGRWRSDSVLLYYRDEDEVVFRIMSAFGRLGERTKGRRIRSCFP